MRVPFLSIVMLTIYLSTAMIASRTRDYFIVIGISFCASLRIATMIRGAIRDAKPEETKWHACNVINCTSEAQSTTPTK